MNQRRLSAGLAAVVLLAGASAARADSPAQRASARAGESAASAVAPRPGEQNAGFFHDNIETRARENNDFRRVLYTGPRSQLVVMSIPPGGQIGRETHARVEQSIFVVSGQARAMVGDQSFALREGDVLVVPPGSMHNVRNTGGAALKLYTVYAPANHLPGRVHATATDAANDRADESYGESVR